MLRWWSSFWMMPCSTCWSYAAVGPTRLEGRSDAALLLQASVPVLNSRGLCPSLAGVERGLERRVRAAVGVGREKARPREVGLSGVQRRQWQLCLSCFVVTVICCCREPSSGVVC